MTTKEQTMTTEKTMQIEVLNRLAREHPHVVVVVSGFIALTIHTHTLDGVRLLSDEFAMAEADRFAAAAKVAL
jgi:hypothetical protein